MFVLQVKEIFYTFFTWPSDVDLRIHLAQSLAFPAITVCNLNPARKSVAHEFGLNDYLKMTSMEQEQDPLFAMGSKMYSSETTTESSEYVLNFENYG